jgi:hypothetical protein
MELQLFTQDIWARRLGIIWGLSWISSVPPHKCQDRNWSEDTTAPFHSVYNPLLTNPVYLCLYSPLLEILAAFSVSWSFYTVGRTPWTGDQPVARPLPAYRTTQTQNKRTQTSIPRMAFEPTIPVFERAKTVHALDRAATVIGTD